MILSRMPRSFSVEVLCSSGLTSWISFTAAAAGALAPIRVAGERLWRNRRERPRICLDAPPQPRRPSRGHGNPDRPRCRRPREVCSEIALAPGSDAAMVAEIGRLLLAASGLVGLS